MSTLRVVGDNAKLRELIAGLKQLTTKSSKTSINVAVGKVVLAGVHQSFAKSQTPYGERWKPLKYRKGKPLILTGALRQSITVRSTSTGNYITSGLVYANTQNFGRGPIPARAYVPGARGIPSAWSAKMRTVVAAHVRKAVKK